MFRRPADRRPEPAATPAAAPRRSRPSSFIGDLSVVLAERDFRRLFATRLISQTGDGVFTAGLGTYVFFNATTYPNPVSGAAAFAVLYLPYSLIGPFAGVFIDRWSRRQILVWCAGIRSLFVLVTALLVASGTLGLPLYLAALLVLGVNRFFLSSLSAALPHVVPEDKLVMANSVSPTAGGICSSAGGLVALGVRVFTGSGQLGSAITLLAAGACYLLAGIAATAMSRDGLGPVHEQGESPPDRLLTELASVAAGLAAGARYVLSRRGPAAALGATGGNKFLYGILFLISILLYRNYFYPGDANTALAHFVSLVVVPAAIGYACAAFVTPAATRRLAKPAWITIMLTVGALVAGPLGETFSQAMFVIIAFCLNVAGQSIAICATTILQEEVEDAYRGRVFAFYDMMSNATFVAGAGLSALFLPLNGKSAWIIGLVGAGYLAVAAGYWAAARPRRAGTGQAGPGPLPGSGGALPGTSSPSPSAQRSSS